MMARGVFPFGQKVGLVRQADRTPKRIFVLGVYASAVHARWIGPDGKQKVPALAVASEPTIFWTGGNQEKLVSKIRIPRTVGELAPAGERFNGPSGRALDDHFLTPLGRDRPEAWLCDLYPYAMLNPRQLKAIRLKYSPLVARHGLPRASLEKAPTKAPALLRVVEILSEIRRSEAEVLILLGDRPITWFLTRFQLTYKRLSDFGTDRSSYGRLHQFPLGDFNIHVLPLVHPRQAARLGASSAKWGELHDAWMRDVAPHLL